MALRRSHRLPPIIFLFWIFLRGEGKEKKEKKKENWISKNNGKNEVGEEGGEGGGLTTNLLCLGFELTRSLSTFNFLKKKIKIKSINK